MTRTVIVYYSKHHGNTEKIAHVMATALDDARLVNLSENETAIPNVTDYDLIGFGSGIYWGKHDKRLLNLVDGLPVQNGKKAFIFSTSGMRAGRILNNFNKRILRKLKEKGFSIVGEFSCRGWDSIGPLKLIGGVHKGKPDERDLEAAADFARGLQAHF